MVVHQHEYWLNEPHDEVLERIKNNTQVVSFKAFYFFNTNHEEFHHKWIGELNDGQDSFTIFRVTSISSTSDFRVTGKLNFRNERPILETKIAFHYSVLLGFAGLLLATVSLSILLSDKFENYNPFILFIPSVTVVFFYGVSQLKDYRKTRQLLDETVNPASARL